MVNWFLLPTGDVVNASQIQRIFIVPEPGSTSGGQNIMLQLLGQDGSILWNTEGGFTLSVAMNIVTSLARASGRIASPGS